MTSVLFAVTGSDYWTLKDGTRHPCGYWPEELAAPHKVFTDAGFDVTFATPGGVRPVPDEAGYTPEMNGGSAAAGQKIRDYIAAIGGEIDKVVKLEDVRVADYDLVFVPGGHGPMEDLAVDLIFGTQVVEFLDSGKPVAAVCHGPAALLSAKRAGGEWAFAGYELTGFSNAEETQVGFADKAPWLLETRLAESGATFRATDPWAPKVVVDRNLYTGQNPASSVPLAQALVDALR